MAAVTGTMAPDTILYSDNVLPVNYQGSVAVATTLPTAITLDNTNLAHGPREQNQPAPAPVSMNHATIRPRGFLGKHSTSFGG
jgi:hypothetical protein